MAQSAVTVTPENPTPPTNMSFVGCYPPMDPAQAYADDGAAGSAILFAAKTAIAGTAGYASVDHEGRGTETSSTQTYSGSIYAPVALVTDGCGPAYSSQPNQNHASSLSPATNPTLTTIAPTTAVSGATGTDTITATGTGFTRQSVIYRDGIRQPTTFVSATSLTAPVTKRSTAGASQITVVSGGVVTTAAQTLTYS